MTTSRNQYRDLLNENEDLKKEAFRLKERSLEAENDSRTSGLKVDKLLGEIKQLREALHRTEETLDVSHLYDV